MAKSNVDRETTWKEFGEAVNMTASELKHYLDSDESKSVGVKSDDDSESVGHHSGRRIVQIKESRKAELTDEDYQHMRKVVGYVHRHLKQGPEGDVAGSRWRYSLMNWGHDPHKQ